MELTILLVAGARPNFMKVAPLVWELRRRPEVRTLLVHTGQHYDPDMSEAFFRDLDLAAPNTFLGVGSAGHAEQTARIMTAFEPVLLRERPAVVVVVGDVNSTLACALVAAKITYATDSISPRTSGRRPFLAHIEAGLRSFDRAMPEEINRVVTDSLSDILFTTSEDAGENLRREGVAKEKIFFVGNVMIDTLLSLRDRANASSILARLGLTEARRKCGELGGQTEPGRCGTRPLPYALCTLHRPSNVDDPQTFSEILEALREIGQKVPVIYPMHPRARQRVERFGLTRLIALSRSSEPIDISQSLTGIEPLGYLDFLHLMANSQLVLTDSGGIQEETTILGIPCVTIRENTERPVTICEGTNTLAGVRREGILRAAFGSLHGAGSRQRIPKKWDGRAAERIVGILLERLG